MFQVKPDVLANPGAPHPPLANSLRHPPRWHIKKRRASSMVSKCPAVGFGPSVIASRLLTHRRPQRARERTHSERDGEEIGEPQARSQPAGGRAGEAATRAGSCPPS